jgi:hypothetical protein
MGGGKGIRLRIEEVEEDDDDENWGKRRSAS